MAWFRDLKLFNKLLIAFGVVLTISALLGAFALMKMAEVRAVTNEVAAKRMPSAFHLSDINTNTSDFRIAELQHIIAIEADAMQRYERDMDHLLEAMRKNQVVYEPLIANEREQRLYQEFKALWERYLEEHQKLIA